MKEELIEVAEEPVIEEDVKIEIKEEKIEMVEREKVVEDENDLMQALIVAGVIFAICIVLIKSRKKFIKPKK